jgi:uncharacterized integral membrane protein
MRIKTIIIILVTLLLTVILMENTDTVDFRFLGARFPMSKLTMMAIIGLISFVLGYLVGRPSRVKRLGNDFTNNDIDKTNSDTLSDEDRDYIS